MAKKIYLDYAAATPLDKDVLEAMQPYFSECFHNPSATYLAASHGSRQSLNDARQTIAGCLGTKPAEIIFTAGATEANNLAIQGLMRQYPDGEVLVSAVEHESILAPAGLYKRRLVPVSEEGIVSLEALEQLIGTSTVLVSVMMVNNELGSLQPIAEVAKLLKKVRQERLAMGHKLPVYLHTDAAQAGNYLDLHVSRLGVDMLSLNGGKIYGPKQSGALYIKAGLKLSPLILGGGQEFGLRSGTENVPSNIGLAAALGKAQQTHLAERARVEQLRQEFEKGLRSLIPRAKTNGSSKHRSPHIVSVSFPGTDNEKLMMQLDEAGVEVAVGSACSASSEEASHVLAAIGLELNQARSTLRFSFGRQTTSSDIKKTLKLLAQFTTV